MRWLGLIFFTFIIGLTSGESQAQVSFREYGQIKRIGESILRQYPPSEYFYLGVGASPTAIIAYLELAAGSNQVGHLPLTAARRMHFLFKSGGVGADLMDQVLDRHFRNFLPLPLIGSRSILLIDYAHHGLTLSMAGEKLQTHLQERGAANSVSMLALTHNRNLEVDLLRVPRMEVFHLSTYAEDLFMGQRFDRYRKFERAELARLEALADYTPPSRQFSDVSLDEFRSKSKMGLYIAPSYELLLQEIKRFMRWDLRSGVRELMQRPVQERQVHCYSVFRF